MVHTIKSCPINVQSDCGLARGHGYDAPIYYYGFGESLLAVKTGDGVDESANRRVLYIVTSDVPPDMPNVSGTNDDTAEISLQGVGQRVEVNDLWYLAYRP